MKARRALRPWAFFLTERAQVCWARSLEVGRMNDRVLPAALAAAILVTAILPRPATAADATVDALFAKHKAYVGWAIGDGVVKTLRAEGHGVRDGKTTETLSELRYGVAFRDTYKSTDGLESNDGFTGSVSWTSNENGFTVRGVGEIVRYLADEQALFGERISDYPGTVVRHEAVDGVDTALVHVYAASRFSR